MKASDLHHDHDGLKSSHPTSNFTSISPSTRWMLLNPSGALRKSHPFSFGSAKGSQISVPVQLLHWTAFWMRLKHLSSSEQHHWLWSKEGMCLSSEQQDYWDPGLWWGTGIHSPLWAVNRAGTSRAISCILCQVPAITAKSQKKAQAEQSLPNIALGWTGKIPAVFVSSPWLSSFAGVMSTERRNGMGAGTGSLLCHHFPIHHLGQITSLEPWLPFCSILALVETKLQWDRTVSPHMCAAGRPQPGHDTGQQGKQLSLSFPASSPSSGASRSHWDRLR